MDFKNLIPGNYCFEDLLCDIVARKLQSCSSKFDNFYKEGKQTLTRTKSLHISMVRTIELALSLKCADCGRWSVCLLGGGTKSTL